MNAWWNSLTTFNQWMYGAAVFFGVFFLFQMLAAFIGLGGDSETDTDATPEHDAAHDVHDAAQSALMFKLFSVRSVVAFFTLFTWAVALYMSNGKSLSVALGLGLVWGSVAMVLVTLLVAGMRRLAYTGTQRPEMCVGAEATVHLHIPSGGEGEIRVLCDRAMTHMRARAADGAAFTAGSAVRVRRLIGPNLVEVEPIASGQKVNP